MSSTPSPNNSLQDPQAAANAAPSTATATTNSPTTNAPSQALGGIAMRGMIYYTIATIVMKFATMLAQIVLGWKLEPQDFGIYSTATAVAGFLMICREAGVREYLGQKTVEEYEDVVGAGFWLAFWYNVLVAIIISLLAVPIARYLEAPVIAPILWCLAVALPIGTLGGILQTGMRVKLMFRQFSSRSTYSGLFRQAVTIGYAYAGFGVMSLAWPALLSAAFESITSYFTLPEKLWKRKMEVHRWGSILRASRWAMFASVANFAVDWGPFVSLPILTNATKAMQGYFAFAWNITAQLGILLSWGMTLVLTPVLARMNDDPQRQAGAVIRSLRALMMVGSVGCATVGAMMAPTEHLLWRGKWEQTVFPAVLLGVFFSWRITFGLTSAILQAQGRFKRYAVITLCEGLGLTLAVTLAARVDPRVDAMAWGASVWLVVSRLIICIVVFRRLGVRPMAVLGSTLPAWTISLVACAAAIAFDMYVLSPTLVRDGATPSMTTAAVDALRAASAAAITVGLSTIGIRIVLRRHIEDALSLVPGKLQLLARKLLFMPESTNREHNA